MRHLVTAEGVKREKRRGYIQFRILRRRRHGKGFKFGGLLELETVCFGMNDC